MWSFQPPSSSRANYEVVAGHVVHRACLLLLFPLPPPLSALLNSLFSRRFPRFPNEFDDPTFPSLFPLLSVLHLCLPKLRVRFVHCLPLPVSTPVCQWTFEKSHCTQGQHMCSSHVRHFLLHPCPMSTVFRRAAASHMTIGETRQRPKKNRRPVTKTSVFLILISTIRIFSIFSVFVVR